MQALVSAGGDWILCFQSETSVSNSFWLNMIFLTVNADRNFADSPAGFAVSVGCCYFC